MNRPSQKGQAMTETLILLPFYLALVFAVIQVGQLGTALIVTNYTASKIARKAAAQGFGGGGSVTLGAYQADLSAAMMAGMKPGSLAGCVTQQSVRLAVSWRISACGFRIAVCRKRSRRLQRTGENARPVQLLGFRAVLLDRARKRQSAHELQWELRDAKKP
jgi:Flp pilus assembly protein TadG